MIVRKPRNGGFALIAALFLLIVGAALATFAVRAIVAEDSTQTVRLLMAQIDAAAVSGIQYGSIAYSSSCAAGTPDLPVGGGIELRVRCSIKSASELCITSRATHANYGEPEFVQRTRYRNIVLAPIAFAKDTTDPCP
jgi:hypothetical protein